jgi:transcriptional regulator with XRE-family HTH domain
MKLGTLIREARERAGLTLADLAKRCRISSSYLCRIEQGARERRPSTKLLERIAVALGLETDAVFAVAGRLPADVERYLLSSPGAMQKLRRQMVA